MKNKFVILCASLVILSNAYSSNSTFENHGVTELVERTSYVTLKQCVSNLESTTWYAIRDHRYSSKPIVADVMWKCEILQKNEVRGFLANLELDTKFEKTNNDCKVNASTTFDSITFEISKVNYSSSKEITRENLFQYIVDKSDAIDCLKKIFDRHNIEQKPFKFFMMVPIKKS